LGERSPGQKWKPLTQDKAPRMDRNLAEKAAQKKEKRAHMACSPPASSAGGERKKRLLPHHISNTKPRLGKKRPAPRPKKTGEGGFLEAPATKTGRGNTVSVKDYYEKKNCPTRIKTMRPGNKDKKKTPRERRTARG